MLLIKICCSKRGQKNHFEAVCFRVSFGGRKAVCAGKRWSISRRKSFYPFIYKRQKGMKVKGITVPPTPFEWREWQVSSEKCVAEKKQQTSRTVFFFSVLWDKPRQQIIVWAPSYASAFFRVTLSILKNKNSFSCSKTRPHSFAHSCVPRVRHCNPLEKHFTNHRQQNVFLLIEKKRRKAWSHSFI